MGERHQLCGPVEIARSARIRWMRSVRAEQAVRMSASGADGLVSA
ncbi:hypothetical protein [Saccharopolyspora gregorii]